MKINFPSKVSIKDKTAARNGILAKKECFYYFFFLFFLFCSYFDLMYNWCIFYAKKLS